MRPLEGFEEMKRDIQWTLSFLYSSSSSKITDQKRLFHLVSVHFFKLQLNCL